MTGSGSDHEVTDPKPDEVAASQFAVDGEAKNAKSRRRASRWRLIRIDQTCLDFSGGLEPTRAPLFQGVLLPRLRTGDHGRKQTVRFSVGDG